jgi:serine protease Do
MSLFHKLRTQKLLSFTMVLFTLSLGIVIGTLVSSGVKAARSDNAAPDATPLVIPNPVQLSTTFSQIAKMAGPSVVNISTEYLPKATPQAQNNGRRRQQIAPPDDDEGGSGGLEEFLRRFGMGGGMPQESQRGEAIGSGVVVDRAGYVLTNNHVVDKADRIRVRFMGDSTEYAAKLIGVDAATDLAVIKVEGKRDFTPLKIGNSQAVQVGDWALAIGSPLSFESTVTAGIISAKERNIPGDTSQFQHFLQTDAAINPGNSGGPLLDMRGEVIGINTAIASRSGGYQGIGFALPINMAANVYNQIIKNGKVTRGSIGITFTQDINTMRNLLKANGVDHGVFVGTVVAGGPSDKAGMKAEDIILSINGKPLDNGDDLIEAVTATPIGEAIDLTVLRAGKRLNLHVIIGNLSQLFPKEFGDGGEPEAVKGSGTAVDFGMTIKPLTAGMRETMGLKEGGGVAIDSVEPGSFAEDIPLIAGDVIVSINHQPVNSIADVQRIQSTLKPGQSVQFTLLRKGPGRTGDWQTVYAAGALPAK